MPAGFLKCDCEHCHGRIEFPVESVGSIANCPHCRLPTPLMLETPDDAGTLNIGGTKAKWVIAMLIGLVFVVVAVGVATAIVKKKKKPDTVPEPVSAPASAKPENSAPRASTTTVSEVPPGDWQNVQPVIGKFQNGLTGTQIKEGRYIFSGGACTECHKMYDPTTFSESQWSSTIGNMRGKAKLRGNASGDLDRFITSVRR